MSEQIGSIHYDLDLQDKDFRKKTKDASGAMGNLKEKFQSAKMASTTLLAGIVGLGAGIVALGSKAFSTASEFETMGVALETTFKGNKKAAEDAQKQIVAFAATTPYQVSEVMGAFIKLKNLGLDPSQNALKSYGDTSSAMGKSLNDMVEAVADAATGEFERLKEFGIRASQEKDKVTFTFRGVKTTVAKNSKDIENYLIKLGQTNFGGGMEKQAQTLSGLLSTLKDNFSIMMNDLLTRSGIYDAVKEKIAGIIEQMGKVDVLAEFDRLFKENEKTIYAVATALAFALIPALYGVAAGVWAVISPLIPFIAVGALVGVLLYNLAQKFGGIGNVLNIVKNGITQLWNIIAPILLPALNELWLAISTELLPALQRMWGIIGPVLVPILQFLAKVLGVVLFTAVMVIINAFTTGVKIVSGFINIWANLIKAIKEKGIDGIKSWFKALPGEIGKMLEGIAKSILAPFDGAFEKLKNKLSEIKNKINDALNPFVRHSPSLVENVTKGTEQILDAYTGMFDTMKVISAQNRTGISGIQESLSAGGTSGNQPLSKSTVTNVTIPLTGVLTSSPGELRQVALRLKEALDQALRTQGPNLNIIR